MRKLRRQWSEFSLEKKLGVLSPVAIAVVTGVVVPILLSGGSSDSEPSSDDREAQLEVIDLAVTDGTVLTPERLDPPSVDLTVRNAGRLVSIVKRVGLRVLEFGAVEICQQGAGLRPSASYDVLLPTNPDEGQFFEVKVSQQIPPGEADRFTLRLEVPEDAFFRGRYLYQLEVLLYHDTDPEPISAGKALVSVPTLPDHRYFWSAVPPSLRDSYRGSEVKSIRQCLKRNDETFRELLALEGERSGQLTLELMEQEA
jgi:hypothetical protein